MTRDLLNLLVLGYLCKHCAGAAAARSEARIARDLQALGVAAAPGDVREAVAALSLQGRPARTSDRGAFLRLDCLATIKAGRPEPVAARTGVPA
jgi:hypothetical protein